MKGMLNECICSPNEMDENCIVKSEEDLLMNYAKYIDHTQLKPESTREQIDKIISEAKEYGFKSVCVNPTHVEYSAEQLKGQTS